MTTSAQLTMFRHGSATPAAWLAAARVWLARCGLLAGARLLLDPDVAWVGGEPSTRQRVYFANHTSHLDTLAIWAALPAELRGRTRPVAAADYWGATPARQWWAEQALNAVLIDRQPIPGQGNPIDQLLRVIGDRDSIIIYPEGTRGRGETPAEFKCGLYHLARRRPNLEFVPVQLVNVGRAAPKGEWLPVPVTCRVTFGAPIALEPGENKADFLARARTAVMEVRR